MFKAVNIETHKTLASQLQKATTFRERSIGLLAHAELKLGQGLWVDRCNWIHTFFMKFPIDAVFIDRDYIVRGCEENILPYRLSWIYFKARSVIELPTHTIDSTQTRVGHRLHLEGSIT